MVNSSIDLCQHQPVQGGSTSEQQFYNNKTNIANVSRLSFSCESEGQTELSSNEFKWTLADISSIIQTALDILDPDDFEVVKDDNDMQNL